MEIIRTILISLTALVTLALALVLLWRQYKQRTGDPADPAADLAHITNLKSLLRAAATNIVNQMERSWEEKGSGPMKLSGAVMALLEMIPDEYLPEFNEDALVNIIEDALAAAKKLWEANPALLGEVKQLTPAIGFSIDSLDEYTAEEGDE